MKYTQLLHTLTRAQQPDDRVNLGHFDRVKKSLCSSIIFVMKCNDICDLRVCFILQ